MLNLLKAAAVVAAKKDVRYYLNGVHIYRAESGKLWLEASDGHVAMRSPLPEGSVIQNTQTPFDIIVPIKDVQLVVKSQKFVVLNVDYLCFSESIRFKPIDGKYPDTIRVFNQNIMSRNKPADEIAFSAELITQVMKAVSFVAGKGSSGARWPCKWFMKASTEPMRITAGDAEFIIMPCRL